MVHHIDKTGQDGLRTRQVDFAEGIVIIHLLFDTFDDTASKPLSQHLPLSSLLRVRTITSKGA